VTRPRAADDFDLIRRRILELRRETVHTTPAEAPEPVCDAPQLGDHERGFRARREGLPPPWVPTIFLKPRSNREIARRFWHIRAGW
jgi:hypothetical protein